MPASMMQERQQFWRATTVFLSALLCTGTGNGQLSAANQDALLREMRTGQVALQHQDYKSAEDAFRKAATVSPDFPDAYLGLGLAQLRSGESNDAVESLRRATELSPQLKGPHLFLGIAEVQAGDAEGAAESLRAELTLMPDNLEALQWLGIVELGRDRAEQAVVPLDHAAVLNPKNPEVLYYQARAHKEVAKNALRKLYEIDPDSALVHRALGESLSEEGQSEKAIAEYEAAVRKDPRNPDLYELMGDEQAKLARYKEAAASYEEELSLNPHSAIALYNLGRIDVEHGKPAEGVAELRRAAEANARPAPTMYYLGFGLAQAGENLEAAKALEASLASSPSPFIEQSALFQLTRVYQRLNRKADAERALTRLKQLKASAVPDATTLENPLEAGTTERSPAQVARPELR